MEFVLLLFLLLVLYFLFKRSSPGNAPPSPPRLPVIGNLHQLGHHPHRSLCSLSRRYGPLMLLHFGRVPVLVVSSADMAQCVLKTHDRTFASRPRLKVFDRLLYGGKDVALAPYGEYWRQMKSVCVLRLLSNKMVRSFKNVREEETNLMMEKIEEAVSSSSPVNLSETFTTLTRGVICRVALGQKYGGEEGTVNFRELLKRLIKLLGSFSLGDYVPWLGWMDRIRGLENEAAYLSKKFDGFMERVVQDHLDHQDERRKMDFVDVLLAIQRDKTLGFEIDMITIKAIILDVFVGGTDTSYTVLEWAMTELLRNLGCMSKLKEEIRTITRHSGRDVSEEDVHGMRYLKAVIQETLRLHPPLPLLVPHESVCDVTLNDYHIPARTHVMINAWAIGRESGTWGPDAEVFRPERHLESAVDFQGRDFRLIPFGSGRRMCPGIAFAIAIDELALAKVVHRFDWEIAGEPRDQISVAESTGIAVQRLSPLIAFPHST